MINKNQSDKRAISRCMVNTSLLIGLITMCSLLQGCTKPSDKTRQEKTQAAPAATVSSPVPPSLSISGDLPTDARYRLPYQERTDSSLARVTYPVSAVVLVDKAPIFSETGKRAGELNAEKTIVVRGIFDALILNDKTGVMNYYYRIDDNKLVSSRDILMQTFSESSSGSPGATVNIISNPVGFYAEDGGYQFDLWLKTGEGYNYLAESRIGKNAAAVSSSSSYFFIKKYENGGVKVYSSAGDQLWDGESSSPALYSPVWVGDTLFLRGRAEYDAVYSLNPATKELKKFLDIPDGKGIADVRDEMTDEAGEETYLFVCGEPIREANGLLKIMFTRVGEKPKTTGKPIMLIDVTADKGGKIISKQILRWISFEELKIRLRNKN